MKRNEPITHLMTTDLKTVHAHQKVSDVRKIMADNGFHHVPVVSGDKLLGIISASDILAISVQGVGSDEREMDAYLDHQFSLESLMHKNLKTIEAGGTVRDAANVLAEGSFHALPVVDGSGKLTGMVTSTDLIRYLRDQY